MERAEGRRSPKVAAWTLAVYTGLAFAVGGLLRQHYPTPIVPKIRVPSSAWVLGHQWFTKDAVRRPAPFSTGFS